MFSFTLTRMTNSITTNLLALVAALSGQSMCTRYAHEGNDLEPNHWLAIARIDTMMSNSCKPDIRHALRLTVSS